MSAAKSYKHMQQIVSKLNFPQLPTPPPNDEMNIKDLFIGTDELSTPLVPDDIPSVPHGSVVAADIYADGNCLPRSFSLAAYGCQNNDAEFRLRIIAELIENFKCYLDVKYMTRGHIYDENYLSRFRAYSSSPLTDEVEHLQDDVFRMRKNGSDMDAYAMAAAASVLGRPVFSVYPKYSGIFVRPDLHRVFLPRQPVPLASPVYILWTRTDGIEQEPVRWKPNHFCLLLPETR